MSDSDIDPEYSLPELASSPSPESSESTRGPSTLSADRSSTEPTSSNEDEDTASGIASEANGDVSASRFSRTRQKRPSEDWTQFATAAARSKKLCNENRESLLKFSSLDQTERDIILCAGMFKINERLDKIQPAEAAFEVMDGLMKFIDLKAFEVITCPDLSAYISKDHPVELIMSILITKETWEISSMKDDPKKWRAVVKCVRKRLTSWRYIIKQAINESIGAPSDVAEDPMNPTNSNAVEFLELCRDIKSRHKNVLEKEPDIEMLGRIAFLRHAHAKYSKSTAATKSSNSKESGFWKYVDKELDMLRQLHNGDNKKISQVLLRILNTDQRLYGSVELPSSKTKH